VAGLGLAGRLRAGWTDSVRIRDQHFSDEPSQFRVCRLVSWWPRRFRHFRSELTWNFRSEPFSGRNWGR